MFSTRITKMWRCFVNQAASSQSISDSSSSSTRSCILVSRVGAWVVQCERALLPRRVVERGGPQYIAPIRQPCDRTLMQRITIHTASNTWLSVVCIARRREPKHIPHVQHTGRGKAGSRRIGCRSVVVLGMVMHDEEGLVGQGVRGETPQPL